MQLGELLGAVLDDEAIERGLHDALFVRRQAGDGFEQQRQALALWPAFVRIEHQVIEQNRGQSTFSEDSGL